VLVTASTLYALSFGPAAWANCRWGLGADAMAVVYRPLYRGLSKLHLEFLASRYAEWGCPNGWPFLWDEQRGPMWGSMMSGGRIFSRRPSVFLVQRQERLRR
jgi:hypothetical protein